MEMKLFGDDLRLEVDIWELFQFHDRHDRSQDPVKFFTIFVFFIGSERYLDSDLSFLTILRTILKQFVK